jgi:hypothetical protein
MPKFSDTVLLHVNRYSDITKQIKRLVFESVLETGRAPRVSAIAGELAVSEEVVRASLSDLEGGIIIAMQNKEHFDAPEFMGQKLSEDSVLPDVGEIYYARPFANFKNHHRIFVDGEQKWYGECPVEMTTASYFFPGKTVRIESVCHHTGKTVAITGRDGQLLDYEPKSLRIYWGKPFGEWLQGNEADLICPCDQNYFFSSEESFNEWQRKHPDAPGQIFTPIQLNHLLRCFNYGHERFDYQYHIPLLKLLLTLVTAGLFRWKMLLPIPNMFFLSSAKFLLDLKRHRFKLFVDVKLW